MSNWTDDPVRDAEYYELENEREEELPECVMCGKKITEEMALKYDDNWCCEKCETDYFNEFKIDFYEAVK